MKTIHLLCIVLFCGTTLFAQDATALKAANRLFAQKQFQEAIEAYQDEELLDQKALQNLADSFFYLGGHQNAVEAYATLFEQHEGQDEEYTLRYAEAAKAVNDYTKANELLTDYAGTPIDILKTIETAEEDLPYVYQSQIVDGVSASSDFGAAYFDRQVVFASSRNTARPIYPWTGEPFLDLYYGKISGTTITDEGLFPGEINTDLHESNAAFTPDGKRMYFTRTNDSYKRVKGEKVATLQIYKADLISGKWTNIEPTSFSNDSYSVAHPSVSPDGRMLFFSSDMPGGFGSYDIYSVEIINDETFGEPRNLGGSINTEQREQFPFISDAGNLYFASNRYMGLGGLDLYRSINENGSFAKAYNMGQSINSNQDDFSLIAQERRGTGYFSSNRNGKDKIYRFDAFSNAKHIVVGVVRNEVSNEPLTGARVQLLDLTGQTIMDTIVGQGGDFRFAVRPNSDYKLKGSKELFIPKINDLDIKQAKVTQSNIDLVLLSYADAEEKVAKNVRNELTQVNLDKIYFDFDQAKIRPDAAKILDELVTLMKKYPEMEVEVSAHTDSRGPDSYNLTLSELRAASTLAYIVSQGVQRRRLQSKGYGETQPIRDCLSQDCTKAQFEDNRRCEFTVLK